MSNMRFGFGDRVRHTKRPEWGIGSVVRVEDLPVDGRASAQRLQIRFPHAGVKALLTSHAELERVDQEVGVAVDEAEPPALHAWDKIRESEWLAPIAEKKIGEAMISLPSQATDPFIDIRKRVDFVLDLFRFDRNGASLVHWAVAQTGLDDPLTRFNRHELEQFFDRWAFERDAQLGRLVEEAGGAQFHIESLLSKIPAEARSAANRAVLKRV